MGTMVDPQIIIVLATIGVLIGIVVSIAMCLLQICVDPKRNPCWIIVSFTLCIINMGMLFVFILQIHGRIYDDLETMGEITLATGSYINIMVTVYFLISFFQFLLVMKSCGWDKKYLKKCMKKCKNNYRKHKHRRFQIVPVSALNRSSVLEDGTNGQLIYV